MNAQFELVRAGRSWGTFTSLEAARKPAADLSYRTLDSGAFQDWEVQPNPTWDFFEVIEVGTERTVVETLYLWPNWKGPSKRTYTIYGKYVVSLEGEADQVFDTFQEAVKGIPKDWYDLSHPERGRDNLSPDTDLPYVVHYYHNLTEDWKVVWGFWPPFETTG